MAEDRELDLISRANSLIRSNADALGEAGRGHSRRLQRRRSFVVSTVRADRQQLVERLQKTRADDDDLPVLTDVIATTDVDVLAIGRASPVADRQATVLAMDLADRVNRQLADALPALLDEALAMAGECLRQGVGVIVARVVHDFVVAHDEAPSSPMCQQAGNTPSSVDD